MPDTARTDRLRVFISSRKWRGTTVADDVRMLLAENERRGDQLTAARAASQQIAEWRAAEVAERDALRARVAAVRRLADEYGGAQGPGWVGLVLSALDGPAEHVDDPYVEAPGFGVTNREYWPLSQVQAAEAGKCGCCEITWQLCRGLYDKGLARCCSDCDHNLQEDPVVPDTDPTGQHVGRSWSGTRIEDICPCPQEPCGLVDLGRTHPDCDEHPPSRAKSMRQIHDAARCPAATGRQAR